MRRRRRNQRKRNKRIRRRGDARVITTGVGKQTCRLNQSPSTPPSPPLSLSVSVSVSLCSSGSLSVFCLSIFLSVCLSLSLPPPPPLSLSHFLLSIYLSVAQLQNVLIIENIPRSPAKLSILSHELFHLYFPALFLLVSRSRYLDSTTHSSRNFPCSLMAEAIDSLTASKHNYSTDTRVLISSKRYARLSGLSHIH